MPTASPVLTTRMKAKAQELTAFAYTQVCPATPVPAQLVREAGEEFKFTYKREPTDTYRGDGEVHDGNFVPGEEPETLNEILEDDEGIAKPYGYQAVAPYTNWDNWSPAQRRSWEMRNVNRLTQLLMIDAENRLDTLLDVATFTQNETVTDFWDDETVNVIERLVIGLGDVDKSGAMANLLMLSYDAALALILNPQFRELYGDSPVNFAEAPMRLRDAIFAMSSDFRNNTAPDFRVVISRATEKVSGTARYIVQNKALLGFIPREGETSFDDPTAALCAEVQSMRVDTVRDDVKGRYIVRPSHIVGEVVPFPTYAYFWDGPVQTPLV